MNIKSLKMPEAHTEISAKDLASFGGVSYNTAAQDAVVKGAYIKNDKEDEIIVATELTEGLGARLTQTITVNGKL